MEEFFNYKNEDVGYNTYDFTTEEGVDVFLHEHTNEEWSLDNYFDDFTIDWDMSASVLLDCINYINETYKDITGVNVSIDIINNEDKIKKQMIYRIGQEIKEDLIGENIEEDEEEEEEEEIEYEEDSDYEEE